MPIPSFFEYMQMREGLILPDRPPAAGMSRINPFPVTQARLQRVVTKPTTTLAAPTASKPLKIPPIRFDAQSMPKR